MLLRLFVLLALLATARAHGDLSERIARLDARIAQAPQDARLRLQRGELHRRHGTVAAAEADFDAALQLDPQLAVVELARAELWLEARQLEKAEAALERFASHDPLSLPAMRLRARVHAQREDRRGEVEARRFVTISRDATPDDFLALARALLRPPAPEALGVQSVCCLNFRVLPELARGPRALAAARALKDGLHRFGALPSLQLRAVELLLEGCDYPSALRLIDSALAGAPRAEPWLALKARVLTACGRTVEAAAAARAGLALVGGLPGLRRETASVRELARELQSYLVE